MYNILWVREGQFIYFGPCGRTIYEISALCSRVLPKAYPLLRIIYEKETLLFGTDAHKSTLLSGTLLITFIEQVPPPRVLITSPRNSLVPGGRQSLSGTNVNFLQRKKSKGKILGHRGKFKCNCRLCFPVGNKQTRPKSMKVVMQNAFRYTKYLLQRDA